MKDKGIYAEYNHHALTLAIEDLCRQLPGGTSEYRSAIRSFALDLYSSMSSDSAARYFVDKTPRYHLIVEDLFELFPDGRFLFLWRNPLAVIASMLQTWQKGRWTLHPYRVDLFEGLTNLIQSFSKHTDQAHAVRYEELVTGRVAAWQRTFEYLDLEFDQGQLDRFSEVQLHGNLGDPVGTRTGASLAMDSTSKWKETLRNPYRKAWCRHYLRWIGEARLAVMGYDLRTLLRDLDDVDVSLSHLGSDLLRASYGWGVQRMRSMAVSGHHAFGGRFAAMWRAVMDQ